MNTVILIEGPGGVGKSTVIELLLKHVVEHSLNPDNLPVLIQFPLNKNKEGYKEELAARTKKEPELVFYEMLTEQAKVLRAFEKLDDQFIVLDRAWISSLVYQIGLQNRDMQVSEAALVHLIGSAIPSNTRVITFKLMCETPTLAARKIARIASTSPEKLLDPNFTIDLFNKSDEVINTYNMISFNPSESTNHPKWTEKTIWTDHLTPQETLNAILSYFQ